MRNCFFFFLLGSVFLLFSCTSKPKTVKPEILSPETVLDDKASVYDTLVAPQESDFWELESLPEESFFLEEAEENNSDNLPLIPEMAEAMDIEDIEQESDFFSDSEEFSLELESAPETAEIEEKRDETSVDEIFIDKEPARKESASKEPALELIKEDKKEDAVSSVVSSESPQEGPPSDTLPSKESLSAETRRAEVNPERPDLRVERSDTSSEPIPMEVPFAQEEKPDTKPPVGFSRTIRALAGQLVEIPYRGMGWIYTGERSSRSGLSYRGRRVDGEGLVFSFLAQGPGTWELMFYKQDFIEDYIIEDYLYLVVGAAEEGLQPHSGASSGDLPRLVADRWPPEPGKKEKESEEDISKEIAEETQNLVEGERAISEKEEVKSEETLTADELYRRALDLYTRSEIAPAITMGENALRLYPEGSAAWYMLMARLYEHDGSARNIRRALAYYEKILSDFPASSEVVEAERRIRYIERFYYGIR